MTALPGWLHILNLSMPATMGSVNAYLIRGPNGVALVDTGLDDATCRRDLIEGLAGAGLGLGDIEKVVCTHHHVDHAGLGKTLKDAGASLLMSRSDAAELASFFSRPERDREKAFFYGRHEVPHDFAERVSLIFPFFRGLAEEFEPDECFTHDETVDLGGIPFRVLPTPGHTPGHICLLQPDEGVLLTGDCVIAEESTHISMRPEYESDDPVGSFISSVKRLRALNGVTALPGHGPPIDDLAARADAIIAYLETRSDAVAQRLSDKPQTAFDLSGPPPGRRAKTFAHWLIISQTTAFLAHLACEGRAECIETSEGLRYRRNGR